MDLQTARSYRDDDRLPSERRQPRVYRTRIDPFVDVWDDVQKVLEAEPRLRAKTLFEDLQRKFPGHFEWGHFEWCRHFEWCQPSFAILRLMAFGNGRGSGEFAPGNGLRMVLDEGYRSAVRARAPTTSCAPSLNFGGFKPRR